ncbi:MAG TPA: phosphatase PAP2 family protein [Kineosporiaceae bacterium]|nr:phosphatase PAP2 family protein [Kineosporiaceae bacterium]
MSRPAAIDRRRFLRGAAGASAGALLAPAGLQALTADGAMAATTTAADPLLPFVEHYRTNAPANLSATTNAAVDIASGMYRLWQTGTAWDNGVVLAPETMRRNMQHCIDVTRNRTDAEAAKAFIYDRQDQSYAMTGGLGPLTELYRTGARAVTSITGAPAGTPATKIDDVVPAGAPAGSATGAGSTDSALGAVVTLVQTLRGNYSSGNPCKLTFQYPRPWRLTLDSTVIDTGTVDAYGFPVYRSEVVVAPQLLRQRGSVPATDGGYLSGHTNAFWLAGLALAYAVPERFQELVTRAFELSDTRIVAGMHSPVDVVGGRILATALAAAILSDPANAGIKSAARAQAAAHFRAGTGATADTLNAYAHSAGPATDPYADRQANAHAVAPRFTYGLPRRGGEVPMVVPQGAQVLLETRLPYLDAAQRREVLRTTALPSGYDLLDGPEQWGRLNLFAAADGYGAFDGDVSVELDAARGGFHAADAWRNDITGRGGLIKRGSGTLTLTGANRYRGGTRVEDGVLVAGSSQALGRGGVRVTGGSLRLDTAEVRVEGDYLQSGGVLELVARGGDDPALEVDGVARLGAGAVLVIRGGARLRPGTILRVIEADRLQGNFSTVTVDDPALRAQPLTMRQGMAVRIVRA